MHHYRAVIMAAGTYRDWDRHSIKILGETTIERTVRLLNENNISDVWVTSPKQGTYNVKQEFVNRLGGNTLDCITGARELNGDIYLYGDVFYTEDAIHKIINGTSNYYGRSSGNGLKKYGEFFAFKTHGDFWKVYDQFLEWAKATKLRKIWSWKLLSFHEHIMKETDPTYRNWTEINDQTDDFDTPEELERWLQKWTT